MVKKKRTALYNQKGQVTIEAILLMIFSVALFTFISKKFKDEGYVEKLVKGPWNSVAGMIENGVWGTPQETVSFHPNLMDRHMSLQGEPP